PARPPRRQARADSRRRARLDGVGDRAGAQGSPRRLRALEARADAAELAAAEADAPVRARLAPARALGASPRVPGTGRGHAAPVGAGRLWNACHTSVTAAAAFPRPPALQRGGFAAGAPLDVAVRATGGCGTFVAVLFLWPGTRTWPFGSRLDG